jgi:hypothetical protein
MLEVTRILFGGMCINTVTVGAGRFFPIVNDPIEVYLV